MHHQPLPLHHLAADNTIQWLVRSATPAMTPDDLDSRELLSPETAARRRKLRSATKTESYVVTEGST
jgi:hypothetical protein